MKYPITKRKDVVEDYFGMEICDPYRWLEEADSPATASWTEEQNRVAQTVLLDHSKPAKYRKELEKIYNVTTFGLPRKFGNKYFWTEKKGNENQSVIYCRIGLNGAPHELVNPNTIDSTGLTSLDFWNVSKNGKYLSYGISKSGNENSTLYILELGTGRLLSEVFKKRKVSAPRWLPDETGFFYTRHPIPSEVPEGETLYHQRVMFHRVGDVPSNDKVIFGEGRKMEDSYALTLSQNGKFLFIHTHSDWVKNDVYVMNVESGKITPIVEGVKNKFDVTTVANHVFLHTNYGADNFRVLYSPLDKLPKKIDDWAEFIPAQKDVLQFIGTTKERIFAGYLRDVSSVVKQYRFDGNPLEDLAIPPISTLQGISTNRYEEEFYYGISNFFCGQQSFRYDPIKKEYKEFRKSDLSLPESEYISRQVWYDSVDGVKVPMFLFHKKGLSMDGKNPTILYGYGGFSSSSTAGFLSSWVPFLKSGGVFAIANIRGGAEFGEKWHRDGMLDKKMNTFNDFNAAAENLIKNRVTSSQKLATYGGSNGGLLVAACMMLRPDLCKAVVSRVALLDMVRFPNFLMAKRWVFEYGDPNKKDDFEKIIKWSPYHNVKKGVMYPAVFFVIANRDVRVDPLHSRKMTALMQYMNSDNVVLLRTEMEAGHGPGKSKKKMIEEQADILAFIDWQLFA